jgi:hypothetical protein
MNAYVHTIDAAPAYRLRHSATAVTTDEERFGVSPPPTREKAMHVTDSNYAVSSWMSLTLSARDAVSSSVTDLDHAGRALVDLPSFSIAGLLGVVGRVFGSATKRSGAKRAVGVSGLFDRDLTDLGLVRLQLASADERSDNARWTAYDPRLPRIANNNSRGRARAA